MLEITQLKFLADVLCLGPRAELKVVQHNADRTLAAGLLDIEDRFGSPAAREIALRIVTMEAKFDPSLECEKAAHEVLSAEVNMMAKAYSKKDGVGDRGNDRGPLTRHKLMEAETSQ